VNGGNAEGDTQGNNPLQAQHRAPTQSRSAAMRRTPRVKPLVGMEAGC